MIRQESEIEASSTDPLQLVGEISRRVSKVTRETLPELMASILEGTRSITGLSQGRIALFEYVFDELHLLVVEGEARRSLVNRKVASYFDPQLPHRGKPLDPNERAALLGVPDKPLLIQPILTEDAKLGELYIVSTCGPPATLDWKQRDLLESLAGLAAVALERCARWRDSRRLREWLNDFSKVFAASRIPTSESALKLYLQEIAESALKISRADFVVLYEYFEELNDVGLPPTLAGSVREESVLRSRGIAAEYKRSVIFRLLDLENPFYAEDATKDWLDAGLIEPGMSEKSVFEREGVRSSAGIPLRVEKERVGVLFINYRREQAFGPEFREPLEVFANQAALAIGNARLFLRSERYSRNLEALIRIGRELGSAATHDIEQIGRLIDQQTQKVISTENFFLCVYEAEGERFRLPYIRDEHDTRERLERLLHQGFTGYVCRNGKPLLATRKKMEELFAAAQAHSVGHPAAIWLGAPLIVREEVIGAIVIQDYYNENTFNREHLNLLEAIALQAAISIDNYRLLHDASLRLEKTQEQLLVSANAILVGQLTTTFIHEAKNSLNGLNLAVQSLQEDIEREPDLKAKKDYSDRLDAVRSEIARFGDLSQRLQRFTRQGLRAEKKEVYLNEVVTRTLQLLGGTLRSRGMRYEARLDPSLERPAKGKGDPVLVDEYQIQQVLMNLIINAIAASAEHRPLLVETCNASDHVEIRVTDFGSGIPKSFRRKLFQPFATTKKDGVGLGLYLSKILIEENHYGSIEVLSSTPGKGSVFAVCLPKR